MASQQGWTQAQAEAAFREGMAQQSSQQGWNQALAGQQNQFTQGLRRTSGTSSSSSMETDMYNRMMEQNKYRTGGMSHENQTDYERQQAALQAAARAVSVTVGASLDAGESGRAGDGAVRAAGARRDERDLEPAWATRYSAGHGHARQCRTVEPGTRRGRGGLQNILKGLNA